MNPHVTYAIIFWSVFPLSILFYVLYQEWVSAKKIFEEMDNHPKPTVAWDIDNNRPVALMRTADGIWLDAAGSVIYNQNAFRPVTKEDGVKTVFDKSGHPYFVL